MTLPSCVPACTHLIPNRLTADVPPRFRPGDTIEYRSIYRGRVRWALPWQVIADTPRELVLYVAPGATGVSLGRDAHGRYMDRWVADDAPAPTVWDEHHVLAVTPPDDAHSLWLMWTESWEFKCWYVQLQSPIVRKTRAIETMDHALDLVIDPDETWHWKDEDDFAEAQQLGVFTPEQAAAVRQEGERVISQRLWITGWEHWRPS
jgi:Protein of unknown function (DUF402)